MIINHNMNAMNAHRNMSMNTVNSGKAMEKLSSGLRINRAGDDAAGLAISEKMRGQIRGLDQASRNSQDAISMIQTAEGGLNETHSILQRMRELAVQAGNDTNTDKDRGEIQKEINQLSSEINRIGNTTEFNNQKLLKGSDTTTNGTTITTTIVTNTPAVPAAGAKGTVAGLTIDAGADNGEKGNINIKVIKNGGTDTSTTAAYKDGQLTITIGTKANENKQDAIETAVKAVITADKIDFSKFTVKGDSSADDKGSTGKLENGVTAVAAKNDTDTKTITNSADKKSFTMQVGANENQTMTLDFADMRSAALGITGTAADNGFTAENAVTDGTNNTAAEAGLDVSTSENAGGAVTKIQDAIDKVSAERSKLGAYQNRLEHTIANLNTSSENLTASESRIRDVDMANEMLNFSKNNILNQASQAMLAQAKQQPEAVLQLLR